MNWYKISQNIEDGRLIGKIYWFEYHCYESPKSCDANLWYHSHQQIVVLALEEKGGGETKQERLNNGEPATYRIRFKDGLEYEAFEDEILDSPNEFTRKNPPKNIKIASPIIEREEDKKYPDIFDIGHKTYYGQKLSKDCKEFIWGWINNSLQVWPAQKRGIPGDTHEDMLGKNRESYYRGRVSQCKNKTRISIMRPYDKSFRDVPNIILSRLYEKFGYDSKIYVI